MNTNEKKEAKEKDLLERIVSGDWGDSKAAKVAEVASLVAFLSLIFAGCVLYLAPAILDLFSVMVK